MTKKPVKNHETTKKTAERKPARKPSPDKQPSVLNLLKNYRGLVTAGLVFILIIIIFHDFILGNSYYLFKDIGSDSLNAVYPQLMLLSKYVRLEGFPLWSFAQGMGQNIMPSFGDPFNLIVILGGAGNAAYSIIIMELVKLVVIAWLFYMFLGYWNLSAIARITGTLLYTFSGFVIVGGSWMVFTTEAVYFTLLLLALEKMLAENFWYLFPPAIALVAIYQPFDLFILGLFLIIYFLFRFFSTQERTWKRFLQLSVKLVFLALMGLLISSFFLVSNILMLLDSPRVSGNSSYFNKLMAFPLFGTEGAIHNLTAALRFFGNDMLGNGSNFKGWYNYLEAPMTYIGLLPLLLFPQVFIHLSKRERLYYGLFFLAFFLPVVFPYFRYAFWAFSGDYYRIFSLFISLVLLLFTIRFMTELDRQKKVNLPLLALTLIILVTILFFPNAYIDQAMNDGLRSFVILMLFIYSILIIFISYSRNKETGFLLLLFAVCIELGWISNKTVNERDSIKRVEWKQKIGYNDYSNEAVSYLRDKDKGFYRIVKDYSSGPAIHNSLNDAKIQDFYGTLSYSSFNQKYYIRFLEELEIIKKGEETQTRWAPGFSGRPLVQRFGSVKYLLTRQPLNSYLHFGYDSITRIGDVKILKNKLCLPLGFVYRQFIALSEFQKLKGQQKEFMLFRACVAEEPVNPEFLKLSSLSSKDSSLSYSWEKFSSDDKALSQDTLQVGHFSNNRIQGQIEMRGQGILFFTIPFDKGWHAQLDGKPAALYLCNIGFMGLLVPEGKHTIELRFVPPYFYSSLWLSIAGLLLYLSLFLLLTYNRKRKASLKVNQGTNK